jgi:hypothetical protein
MLEFRTQNPLALLLVEVSACALFVPPSVRSSGKRWYRPHRLCIYNLCYFITLWEER